MSKSLKLISGVFFAVMLQSCGSEPGCLCSDGTTETAVPNIEGGPCSSLTPPAGFNFCFQPGSDHLVDPWMLGPVSMDVAQPLIVSADGDVIDGARWLTAVRLGT